MCVYIYKTESLCWTLETKRRLQTNYRLVLGAQSCPTLCNPTDWSLPGSSVHGILEARIPEWVAISFSRGSSQHTDWTEVYCIASGFFTDWATRETNYISVFKRFHAMYQGLDTYSLSSPLKPHKTSPQVSPLYRWGNGGRAGMISLSPVPDPRPLLRRTFRTKGSCACSLPMTVPWLEQQAPTWAACLWSEGQGTKPMPSWVSWNAEDPDLPPKWEYFGGKTSPENMLTSLRELGSAEGITSWWGRHRRQARTDDRTIHTFPPSGLSGTGLPGSGVSAETEVETCPLRGYSRAPHEWEIDPDWCRFGTSGQV